MAMSKPEGLTTPVTGPTVRRLSIPRVPMGIIQRLKIVAAQRMMSLQAVTNLALERGLEALERGDTARQR